MVAATMPASRMSQPSEAQQCKTNVGDTERLLSLIGGGALAIAGLAKRSLAGVGMVLLGGALIKRGLTGHCEVYHAFNVDTSGRGPVTSIPAGRGIRIEQSLVVHRTPEDLYRFWRNFENLPRFMRHLESVSRWSADGRSHWVARGPMGISVEWDASLHNDRPNELIAWRSLPGSQVDTAGSVHFEPLPGGRTRVTVNLKYDPPGGKPAAYLARLFGQAPERMIADDLRRFKEMMEAGATAPRIV